DQDELGNSDPLTLINAPYQGNAGVYSYGGYVYDIIDEDSTLILTPTLDVLNDTAFAFQVEFMVDTIRPGKPIIMAGGSWRFLGVLFNSDATLWALQNGIFYETTSAPIQVEQWYTITVVHDKEGTGMTRYYLDDNLFYELEGQLEYPESDAELLNSHNGQGTAFRGNWRNLKVYGPAETTNTAWTEKEQLRVFPNPVSDILYLTDLEQVHYRLMNMEGRLIRSGLSTDGQLYMGDLPDGTYLLQVEGESGIPYRQLLYKCCR
ncbi:MAG: T9SS type A sorting domain-containing protein, partial [Phaeodactylibacter sp.]|nr:T9SS type A sorting domain-containing protein [Phaeodactylibacter sp.]